MDSYNYGGWLMDTFRLQLSVTLLALLSLRSCTAVLMFILILILIFNNHLSASLLPKIVLLSMFVNIL